MDSEPNFQTKHFKIRYSLDIRFYNQHSLTYHYFITIRYLLDIQGNINKDNIPQLDIGYTFDYAFRVAFLQETFHNEIFIIHQGKHSQIQQCTIRYTLYFRFNTHNHKFSLLDIHYTFNIVLYNICTVRYCQASLQPQLELRWYYHHKNMQTTGINYTFGYR